MVLVIGPNELLYDSTVFHILVSVRTRRGVETVEPDGTLVVTAEVTDEGVFATAGAVEVSDGGATELDAAVEALDEVDYSLDERGAATVAVC